MPTKAEPRRTIRFSLEEFVAISGLVDGTSFSDVVRMLCREALVARSAAVVGTIDGRDAAAQPEGVRRDAGRARPAAGVALVRVDVVVSRALWMRPTPVPPLLLARARRMIASGEVCVAGRTASDAAQLVDPSEVTW